MNNFDESITRIDPVNRDAISIIQITDTHIMDEGAESFNDFDTTESLKKVIKRIKENEKNIDLVLLTGDLVHEPTKTAYQKLADILIDITAPLFCLPGNHDNPEMMEYVMGANGVDPNKIIQIGNWAVIMLNTNAGGGHGGNLSSEELEFLGNSLQSIKNHDVLIALHHHPVSINSTWMDGMMLDNPDEFFDILDQYENVKGIIWGHIHQEFLTQRNNVQLLGTPSSCLQFKPESSEFAVDDKTPAYRKINLTVDSGIESKVVYI